MNAKSFLIDKGFFVKDTKEYALTKEDAMHYIKLLNNENKIILGGDVYSLDINMNVLIPTYDNWYIELDKFNNGYKDSKEYIDSYVSKDIIYFVIVTRITK